MLTITIKANVPAADAQVFSPGDDLHSQALLNQLEIGVLTAEKNLRFPVRP